MREQAEKRTIKTPKVHVYTGDGKGKTTAALGLALRAAGCGFRVVMVQFLKSAQSGELAAIAHVPGFSVVHPHGEMRHFFWEMTNAEKAVLKQEVQTGFACAERLMCEQACDILILDEIFGCLQNGLLGEHAVLRLIQNRTAELVLTGRNAPQAVIDAADYVSEIHAVRHPMESGLAARQGIEF